MDGYVRKLYRQGVIGNGGLVLLTVLILDDNRLVRTGQECCKQETILPQSLMDDVSLFGETDDESFLFSLLQNLS